MSWFSGCARVLPCITVFSFVFIADSLSAEKKQEDAGAKKSAPSEVLPPLHQRIDQEVAEGNIIPLAARSSDAEFVRRVYLDLTGSIPSSEETRRFLTDPSVDKRTKLVDSLLGSRDFIRHMATTFDVWLMERRPGKHVKDNEFRSFLIESFAANKPYNQLVYEILSADGTEEKNRSAARFYLDRNAEPNLLTRDVGRIFFGRDLQCAQCHDHPNISDYMQREYYGIYAFFNRTYLFQPDRKKPAMVGEKAEGEADFKSVFTEVSDRSLPLLPGSKVIADPEFKPGEEWLVKPDKKDKKVKPVPKYSRRQQIAKLMTEGQSDVFNRNIANRLWAHMMGRGLVEPFDFHHASNPPTHPELMDLLAESIVGLNYDVKAFLRELALSDTYQRSFEMPETLMAEAEKIRPTLPVLQKKEEQADAARKSSAKHFEQTRQDWEEQKLDLTKMETELTKANKKRDDLAAAVKKSEAALAGAAAKLAEPQKLLKVLEEAVSKNAEVLKLLPKDKEFAAASDVVKTKADKARADLAKLTADKVAKDKALAKSRADHKQAESEASKLQQGFAVQEKKVNDLKQKLDAALMRYERDKRLWKHAQRVQEDAAELVAYADVKKELQAAVARRDGLKQPLDAARMDADKKGKLAADLAKAVTGAEAASAQLKEDAELASSLKILRQRHSEAQSKAEAAKKLLEKKGSEFAAAEKQSKESAEKHDAIYTSLTDRLTRTSAVGVFQALTPEQLCQSIVTASGEKERAVAAGNAEFDKKLKEQEAARKKAAEEKAKAEAAAKLAQAEKGAGDKTGEKKDDKKKAEAKKDPKKAPEKQLVEADRQQYVEEYVDRRMSSAVKKFIQLFGGQAGEAQGGFFATADQALFLANDGLVRGWLSPSGGNLTDRLSKMEKTEDVVREIYLSVLNREPDAGEIKELKAYLEARPDQKNDAVQELAWSLISSVEFRFKH